MLDPESSGPVGRSWAWSGLGGTAPLTGVPTCCRKGLTFVSVHDCFWTHAADVAVMNQVCREQFVRLHSQPILHDLSRFLVERFCSGPRSKNVRVSRLLDVLLSVPKTGAFNLEQVKQSTYFFS